MGASFLPSKMGRGPTFLNVVPRTIKFEIDEHDPADQYAQFYAGDVVAAINALKLPRYGLANYVAATPQEAT